MGRSGRLLRGSEKSVNLFLGAVLSPQSPYLPRQRSEALGQRDAPVIIVIAQLRTGRVVTWVRMNALE